MFELWESKTFKTWRERLRDKRTRLIVTIRLDRLAHGHAGDAKSVGDGVLELRIHYGPGYRIYYQLRGGVVVLLLCGGDKSTQPRDIALAKQIAADWSEDNG